MHLQHNINILN